MSRPADVTLERFRLGELPLDRLEALQRAQASDHTVARRLRELDRSDDTIRAAYPPSELAADVRSRLYTDRPASHRRFALWMIPVGVAAATLFVMVNRTTDDVRIKGAPVSLLVYRQTPAGSEALADNDVVRAGDLLRVGYRVSEKGYGLIVSLDGRGVVTPHLPAEGDRAVALDSGSELVDSAFELDDAPERETFYFVTAASSFDAAPVIDAIRRAGRGPGADAVPQLPAFLNVVTLSLRKDPRP